jgi:hypothetical protein
MTARLILLEIVNTDRHRIYRNEYHPFIQALVRSAGVPCTWLSLGVPARTAATGENLYLYDPGADDTDRAAAALAGAGATHVLLNERLEAAAFERLRTGVPGARFHLLQMSPSGVIVDHLEDWLGLDFSALRAGGRLLEEAVRPDFERVALNDLARSIRPYPSLLLGPGCDYVRSLDGHQDFTALGAAARGHRGCSFCINPDPRLFVPRMDPVTLALQQLAGAAETLDLTLQDRDFMVRGVNLLPRIADFADALDREGVAAATFHLSTRVDRILRHEATLRQALGSLQSRGHRLHIWNMGIENHSPRENQRLNKGLSQEQLREGIRCVLRLAGEFPDGFGFGGWGYILYTPWTTPEDLRINIRELAELSPSDMGFALGSALQLLPGLPVTELAGADGLLVPDFEDLPTDSGCISTWDGFEIPWRFRDPRVARMYLLTRRFQPRGVVPDGDPILSRVQRWTETLPRTIREDLGALTLALLDVLEDGDALPGVEEHLARAGAALAAAHPEPASAPTAPQGSPEQVALFDALRAGVAGDGLPIGAFTVDGIRLRSTGTGGRIEVTLTGGPAPLEVLLERTPEDAPAFLRVGALALSYKARDPGPTAAELDALRGLLEHAGALDRID